MKIGIEAQRIFRAHKHGMDVVAVELIRRLQKKDVSNIYYLFAADRQDTGCIQETPNFHGKRLHGLSYADREQIFLPLAVNKYRPDLLHCTANTAPLRCPVPLVLSLHDIIYLEEIDFNGSAYQNVGNLYRRWVVPPAIRKAARIITVSEYERGVISRKFPEAAGKISVIYNGVDKKFHENYSAAEKEAFRVKYRLPEQFILFLGNTAPKKNAAAVVKAYVRYCEIDRCPLPIVISDYEKGNVVKILNVVKRSDLLRSFIFTGYVPGAEMPLLYNCSTLFLYPSLRESFGLPILEAMACGVPVITSLTGAMPEVSGGAAMLVNPGSYEEIAHGMHTMLADGGLRDSSKQKGRLRAGQFSWDTAADQLLQIYQITSMESP